MIRVPAGNFLMGSCPDDADAEGDEMPLHSIYLDTFWIDRTEVTNAQYSQCVQAGVCRALYYASNPNFNSATQPAVAINWNDAAAFCRWAGKQLPTEAQWEKAARGTDGRLYPWGNERVTCERAVIKAENNEGCGTPAPWSVDSKPGDISPYGALDMAGNVWEWVADWYDPVYYKNSPPSNPKGPNSGTNRVIRGGSWVNDYKWARAAHRHSMPPIYDNVDLGFRCAASGWETYDNGGGSRITPVVTSSVLSYTLQFNYDLKQAGWVGFFEDIDPPSLAGAKGIRFSYYGSGASNTIELKLIYVPGRDGRSTVFSTLWHKSTATNGQTVHLEASFGEFACWTSTGCISDEKLDLSRVGRIDFAISNKGEVGDVPGEGALTIVDMQVVR